MLAFVIYLLLIVWLIWKTAFFDLLRDEKLSGSIPAGFFLLKALAVPVFYFVYKKLYGGIETLDAGKFYGDACVIGSHAFKNPMAFLRLMFGMQNDQPGSQDYVDYLSRTLNWDNGTMKDYLYNDNRIVIRVHALLYFISFGSYYVQALFNCLLGFLGIFRLYQSFKKYFSGKEIGLLAILCFFPSLWFYSGAVLKEGIVLFVLGHLVWFTLRLIQGEKRISVILAAFFLFYTGCLLKPYIILFCWFCLSLFFVLENKTNLRYKALVFVSTFVLIFFAVDLASRSLKGRSVTEAVMKHRRTFSGVAKGGIYLYNKDKYIRLEYDTALLQKRADSVFSIKNGSPYMFWTNNNAIDTFFCKSNTDVVSEYRLEQMVSPSRSNIGTGSDKSPVGTVASALYHSLCYPLFINASGIMQWLGSFENLLILLSFAVIMAGAIKNRRLSFFVVVLVFMTVFVCLLAGVATPNSGAIFRYRSPVAAYLMIAALYYLPFKKRAT